KPTSGKVFLDGNDIWKKPKAIRAVRFQVGLCFQYPEYQLFEETVYKDIAFGPKCKGLSRGELDDAVREAAELVGLSERLLSASPFDLSGGEKRRAAIAGVMAMRPRVLILDEPTAGLDPRGREKILSRVVAYRDHTGSSVILISHSMEDVANTCGRVLVMKDGRVEMLAPTAEVFAQSERLCGMGLEVPQVTRIFMELRRRGVDVSPSVFTMEQAKSEALRLIGQ
ncbi:MAG: ATP-binding cassette domain-containing protein, partial [Oscillospiraceae bacterium]|nr:ATP-binding cassette domain-containing protein [Oscillospiraceae bacterium]